MSRAANDVIGSDHAPEYYWLYTDWMERELAYWLAPEQAINQAGWVAQVLSVIEMMLLFEPLDNSHLMDQEKATHRWRDVVLGVWDSEWQDEARYGENYLYGKPEYRKQHRPAIIAMFDRLENLAQLWADNWKSGDETTLPPLLPDYPLPYFSVKRWTKPDGQESFSVERFTYEMIEQAAKDIIYGLSPEKREDALNMNIKEVWVAVDVLGFLCESYRQSPGVNNQMVRAWRETTVQVWKEFLGDDPIKYDDLYKDVIGAFERLEAVARKYPPEW